jgi:hypothetical protein
VPDHVPARIAGMQRQPGQVHRPRDVQADPQFRGQVVVPGKVTARAGARVDATASGRTPGGLDGGVELDAIVT